MKCPQTFGKAMLFCAIYLLYFPKSFPPKIITHSSEDRHSNIRKGWAKKLPVRLYNDTYTRQCYVQCWLSLLEVCAVMKGERESLQKGRAEIRVKHMQKGNHTAPCSVSTPPAQHTLN